MNDKKELLTTLRARGISDESILRAFHSIPRSDFVSESLRVDAYSDRPLPIGYEQTISQPYVVALMIELLSVQPQSRVLEIGTGSGYAAAILSYLADIVYSVERIGELAEGARKRLEMLGFNNVRVRHGDGNTGWQEHSPYNGIIVAAASPEIPPALIDQLAVGGRLVIPLGDQGSNQQLVRITKVSVHQTRTESFGEVRFVPLVSEVL